MSDFGISKQHKRSLSQKCLDQSGPLDTTEIRDRNESIRKGNFKCTEIATAYPIFTDKELEERISPGTEVCVSALPEADCDAFNFSSDNELNILDINCSINVPGKPFNKNNISGEMDKIAFVNYRKKGSNALFPGGSPTKFNVDNHSASSCSNSKQKNNSQFSILGQLLNKRPNSTLSPRGVGSSNNQSLSFNSRQYSPSHILKDDLASESSDGAQRAQMKTKLRSMWNNMKYGWRIKREVNLKTDPAVWILGQCYHNKDSDGVVLTQDVADQLRLDLLSKIWLTYRINFPAIPGTNLVSDSGWGCMLRCAQMMMAQAFVCHFLQRDWRLSSDQPEAKNEMYKMILRWFGDSLSEKSPFSLHHLVSLGENYGRKAGDWYGPTHAAHVLRDALFEAKKHHPLLQQLCMYVASDGIVFKQDVMDLCMNASSQEETNSLSSLGSDFASISLAEIQESSEKVAMKEISSVDFDLKNTSSGICDEAAAGAISFGNECPSYSAYGPPSYSTVKPKWKSLILFVSVRLGNDKINPFYIPCLKSLLAYEHCIGIIGGRPKHALYFIGWQDDKIIHMDPHSCQPAVDVEKEDFSEKSFHSSSVRTMSFKEMDPSCAIGFYFRELIDFQTFVEKFSEITAPLKRNLEYPVFALADGKRVEIEDNLQPPLEKRIFSYVSSKSHMDDDDDDDYILL